MRTVALCPRWTWSELMGVATQGAPATVIPAVITCWATHLAATTRPRVKGARGSVVDERVQRVPTFTSHRS